MPTKEQQRTLAEFDHAHPMTDEERQMAVLTDIVEMESALELASRLALRKRLADFMVWLETDYAFNPPWRGQDYGACADEYLTGVDDAESQNAAANEIRHPWAFMPDDMQSAATLSADVTIEQISDALKD